MKFVAYVINLESSGQRRDHAARQLDAAGIPYEFVKALDARCQAPQEFPEYNEGKAIAFIGRPLTSGEVGCYLSHLHCLRHFLETDNEYCYVFEDDFQIIPQCTAWFHSIPAAIQTAGLDVDIVNLARRQRRYSRRVLDTDAGALEQNFYFPISAIGLLWSRKGARAFLEYGSEIHAPVDIFFRSLFSRKGTGFALAMPLITQATFASDIDAVKSELSLPRPRPPKNLLFFLRNARRRYLCYAHAFRNKYLSG
ncbi:glycosyltransferase family 25 protein [Roseinatronobacter sp. NSM]|uniref:glycosyltransferase family 25 protein n=1 Tax=Roseinatronobacter sp. NSM TaxID=3457785 RepID=UPI0040355C8F